MASRSARFAMVAWDLWSGERVKQQQRIDIELVRENKIATTLKGKGWVHRKFMSMRAKRSCIFLGFWMTRERESLHRLPLSWDQKNGEWVQRPGDGCNRSRLFFWLVPGLPSQRFCPCPRVQNNDPQGPLTLCGRSRKKDLREVTQVRRHRGRGNFCAKNGPTRSTIGTIGPDCSVRK